MTTDSTITTELGTEFPIAERELSNDEIASLYGSVIERTLDTMLSDPGMLVVLAEGALKVAKRREQQQAAAARRRSSKRAGFEGSPLDHECAGNVRATEPSEEDPTRANVT